MALGVGRCGGGILLLACGLWMQLADVSCSVTSHQHYVVPWPQGFCAAPPIFSLILRGGGEKPADSWREDGTKDGADMGGDGQERMPRAANYDPEGILDGEPELKPGPRYAGVGGYEDDGLGAYRVQAIKKDILDWDIDDNDIDETNFVDPEVAMGKKPAAPFVRDMEKSRPTEQIFLPDRSEAFENMGPIEVDPNGDY